MASSSAAEWEEPAEAHAGEIRKLSTLLEASQALSALGETGSPEAMELLVRVVREPQAEGSESEKQQALDVRIAAGFRQNLPVPFYRMPRGRFLREIL